MHIYMYEKVSKYIEKNELYQFHRSNKAKLLQNNVLGLSFISIIISYILGKNK